MALATAQVQIKENSENEETIFAGRWPGVAQPGKNRFAFIFIYCMCIFTLIVVIVILIVIVLVKLSTLPWSYP